jgi:hypothetical protein
MHDQWGPDRLLGTTIVPWTAEWLLHYELSLATGTWLGSGHHNVGPTRRPYHRTSPQE